MSMDFTNHRLNQQLVPTEVNKINPTDTVDISCSSRTFDNDQLYDMLPDLVNPQFKAWYCKRFYALGKDEILKLAAVARQDAKKDPRRYFSYLIK